ncbi:MAG: hypothetical protein RLZZ312_614 [Bacteroidota bacterium]|jgi:hypothetical protein
MKNEYLLQNLKFPVGEFQKLLFLDDKLIKTHINTIASFPENLQKIVQNCSSEQLNFRYRPNGWTVKQVVHHCADSHMNAFLRIKLVLTENNPTITPYNESLWAELSDGFSDNINPSLEIIGGIHHRWSNLLKSLADTDFLKTYYHPESKQNISIWQAVATYDWHCRHHLAHLKNGIESNGKYN